MDSITLVDNQIADGEQLIDRLRDRGIVVRAAYWVKPTDEDLWSLYLATPLVDSDGLTAAYRTTFQVFRTLENPWMTDSEIKLVGETHASARDVCDLMTRHPGRMAIRSRRPFLGGTPVEEIYIYPPVQSSDPRPKLADEQKKLLQDLYASTPLAADELPYTEDMERIHAEFVRQTGLQLEVRDVYKALLSLRKLGRLDRKLRTPSNTGG